MTTQEQVLADIRAGFAMTPERQARLAELDRVRREQQHNYLHTGKGWCAPRPAVEGMQFHHLEYEITAALSKLGTEIRQRAWLNAQLRPHGWCVRRLPGWAATSS